MAQFSMEIMRLTGSVLRGNQQTIPKYFECGCCGDFHVVGSGGDCREDDTCFTGDQLDDMHGEGRWDDVDIKPQMAEADESDEPALPSP